MKKTWQEITRGYPIVGGPFSIGDSIDNSAPQESHFADAKSPIFADLLPA